MRSIQRSTISVYGLANAAILSAACPNEGQNCGVSPHCCNDGRGDCYWADDVGDEWKMLERDA
jgi:hypothetical protein